MAFRHISKFWCHRVCLIPCISLLLFSVCRANKNLPVVLWHGMGASCCERGNTNIIQKELEEQLGPSLASEKNRAPGTEEVHLPCIPRRLSRTQVSCRCFIPAVYAGSYVLSITTGGSEAEQVYAGFFGNVSQQVRSLNFSSLL